MISSGPYHNYDVPGSYDKDEMHTAVLDSYEFNRTCRRGHLEFMHYPFDKQTFNNMGVRVNLLEFITKQFNQAGYHIHAYEAPANGFDLWVERLYKHNRWGDVETYSDYKQKELPPFYGDLD